MLVLELHHVGMAFGRRVLFRDISASVAGGAVIVVTGANGSGKSTLLRIIAGLVRPEAGAVRLHENQASAPAGLHRFHKIGFASPAVNLYANLTGAENLRFLCELRGVPGTAVEEALTQVGLSRARGDQLAGLYSSGMQQRLKLASSILSAPPLLIWDEPTATLDAAGARIVDDLLAGHRSRGGIAVVATNNADEAQRWSDHQIAIG